MFDLHTHSLYSFDSTIENGGASIEQMCEQGIAMGLDGMAITDHYELFSEEDKKKYSVPTFDLKKSKDDISLLNEKYQGEFKVLFGIELGSPAQDPDFVKSLVKEHEFEFVVISSHKVAGIEDFWFLDYDNTDDKQLLVYWENYLKELVKDASIGIGDTIAHITYPYRYFKHNNRAYLIDLEKNYKEYYEDVLKALIRNNISLEINTAGLRYYLNDTLPTKAIVDFYFELGGRKITIGSDAHKICDVGQGFDVALSYLPESAILPHF